MPLHLFAGLRVRDFQTARASYELLLGEPTFLPHAREPVWTLAEDRSVYVVEHAAGAGHSVATIFIDDLIPAWPRSPHAGLGRTSSRRTPTGCARWSTATRTVTSWGSAGHPAIAVRLPERPVNVTPDQSRLALPPPPTCITPLFPTRLLRTTSGHAGARRPTAPASSPSELSTSDCCFRPCEGRSSSEMKGADL